MSNRKKSVLIYENLPSGGAKSTQLDTLEYIKKHLKVTHITEPKYHIFNILHYIYVALITSPKYQKEAIRDINHDIVLAYHSWLVKTPSILRYTSKPKIYICHETMREYYDAEHIKTQGFKERITNFLRLPIKYLDRINVQAKNTTVVANSMCSKKTIDRSYKVNSLVIYPGVNTKLFGGNDGSSQENQVICISAINRLKRQDFLVEVIGRLAKRDRPTLVLVGNGADGSYLNYLKERAKLLGVKIKIMINVSQLVKVKELHKSKVFMYAPISEPFGIVVEEALAAGLPILTYAHGGGYNEVISTKNGIILNSLDLKIWSQKLKLLLTNTRLFEKFNNYNTRYAMKYMDSKVMNKNILKLIENTL